MDRIEEGAIIIKQINKYRKGDIDNAELIEYVYKYFDRLKNEYLSISDLKFLKYISNVVGIPHYFDMLSNFNQNIDRIEEFDLNTFTSLIHEATLFRSDNIKIHRYQRDIINCFNKEQLNRFFLSASTSFGKTFVVYEIIKKMQYSNIALIFPTIALLSENYDNLITDPKYKFFTDNFSIHTLSEVEEMGEKNIFIYTPERFLSFIEKNSNLISFDFVFIDEAYKIDNEYLLDEEAKENERDVAYRMATHYSLLNSNSDILLVGPYIEFSILNTNSFNIFLKKNKIKLLDFNNIEIVGKSYYDIKTAKQLKIDDSFIINFNDNNKEKRLENVLFSLKERDENAILYCATKSGVEKYANSIVNSSIGIGWDSSKYIDFIKHLKKKFCEDWILIKALENGIGIHHGLIPKYIQKEIINLFNQGLLFTLVSTTTITEGVNTSAKNIIVLHDKKGNKKLKRFDAKNISGRAGRFLSHYSGRVIIIQNEFLNAINGEAEEIKHKNYDIDSPKDEVDLFYTDNQFLTENDQGKKNDIKNEQEVRGIPDSIMQRYNIISRNDKIKIYDSVNDLTLEEKEKIRKLISSVNMSNVDFDGLQIVLNLIMPIIKNEKLKWLIEFKKFSTVDSKEYSIFIYLLYFYLKDGFKGSMDYKIKNGGNANRAIRDTADFIFNILKYQAVKYLGVFNLMYKYIKSKEDNKSFDDVIGIDRLLVKLEYNALTQNGRLASDYGVPYKVLEFYEKPSFASDIEKEFDGYEVKVFKKIEKIINERK